MARIRQKRTTYDVPRIHAPKPPARAIPRSNIPIQPATLHDRKTQPQNLVAALPVPAHRHPRQQPACPRGTAAFGYLGLFRTPRGGTDVPFRSSSPDNSMYLLVYPERIKSTSPLGNSIGCPDNLSCSVRHSISSSCVTLSCCAGS